MRKIKTIALLIAVFIFTFAGVLYVAEPATDFESWFVILAEAIIAGAFMTFVMNAGITINYPAR